MVDPRNPHKRYGNRFRDDCDGYGQIDSRRQTGAHSPPRWNDVPISGAHRAYNAEQAHNYDGLYLVEEQWCYDDARRNPTNYLRRAHCASERCPEFTESPAWHTQSEFSAGAGDPRGRAPQTRSPSPQGLKSPSPMRCPNDYNLEKAKCVCSHTGMTPGGSVVGLTRPHNEVRATHLMKETSGPHCPLGTGLGVFPRQEGVSQSPRLTLPAIASGSPARGVNLHVVCATKLTNAIDNREGFHKRK